MTAQRKGKKNNDSPKTNGDARQISTSQLKFFEERNERSRHFQQVLYNISNAVHTTADSVQLFQVIQSELGKIVDTTNFFIALLDSETDRISLSFQKDEKDQLSSFPPGKTLTGYVIRTGRPLLADKQKLMELYEEGRIDLVGTPCEIWLGVPLIIEKKIIGAVVLQSYTDGNAYTQEDLEILTFVSEQIAIAIHRKNVENNLRSLTSMIEQASDSIIQMDVRFHITYINEAARELLGWSIQELKGKRPDIFGVDERWHVILKEAYRHLAKGIAYKGEGVCRRKNGVPFYCKFSVSPLMDQNGKPDGFMTIIQDTTQQKQEEEHRRKLEDRLLQAQKMEAVGNLASGIAHDFNNILGVIIGYSQLVMDDIPENSTNFNNLSKVMTAAERAKEVVKQILTFSRKSRTEHSPLDVSKVLKDSLSLLRASLPSTIAIHLDFADNLEKVMANSTQMHQVIMNICTNAAHAMKKEGGTLDISLKEVELGTEDVEGKDISPGKYQQLRFKDTGAGMTEAVMARIFEPYFTTKGKDEGTGMGLAVVHGIIKSHNGDISVYSHPGMGTVFNIFLPVTYEKYEDRLKKEEAIPGGNERILFIDDEPVLVQMGKLLLERLGYTVDIYTGSLSALDAFKADPNQYDLVFTDQTMPVMTGLQLAEKIKSIRPNIPIIICTGFSESIDEDNFKSKGVDGFILKPIIKSRIARVIRDLLDSTKA